MCGTVATVLGILANSSVFVACTVRGEPANSSASKGDDHYLFINPYWDVAEAWASSSVALCLIGKFRARAFAARSVA